MRWLSLVIISVLFSYIGTSALEPLSGTVLWVAKSLVVGSFVAILGFVYVVVRGRHGKRSAFDSALVKTAYFGMGFLSFLLLLTLARDLVSLLLPFSLRNPEASLGVFGGSFVLMGIGFWQTRRSVRVKETNVFVKDLPAELNGFRIVQISDLHISVGIRQDYVDRVVHMANDCQPDIVVLTGDIGDGHVGELREDAQALGNLRAAFGKFYVTGNHEHYWNATEWTQCFESLGFSTLHNRHDVVRKNGASLVVAGVPDIAASAFRMEGPDVAKALRGAPEGARVLLSHQTRVAKQAAEQKVDLLISGHTHGGQFYPWTWVVKMIDPYPHGLMNSGDMQIYVSRGTGYWGPPIRLGSPPEVTLLVLKRTA